MANMGEENGPANFTPNGQTTEQQKAMVSYLKQVNPYNSFVVIHTHANPEHRYSIFNQLLGFEDLNGPSIQVGNRRTTHSETLAWLQKSDSTGHQWVVCLDEIGPASQGVDPDEKPNNNQDSVRHEVLYGNLMAGGGGYKNPHNDLNLEDFRSRENIWKYTRLAKELFQNELPFAEMTSTDDLTSADSDYCFSKPGEIYAIYLPATVNTTELDLTETSGNFTVSWFDPRNGGEFQKGSVETVEGGGKVSVGNPPAEPEQDWLVLVRK